MSGAQTPPLGAVVETLQGAQRGPAASRPARKGKQVDPDAAKKKEVQQRRRAAAKESVQRREQYSQLGLLWHEKLLKPVGEHVLQQAARYLTPQGFDEVVAERAASNMCGYPLCDRAPKKIEQRYHISLARKKVYDMSEQKQYCGSSCMVAARFYRYQVPEDPIYMRSRVAELKIDVLPVDFTAEPQKLVETAKAAMQEPRADDVAWYRRSLIGSMNIPEDVAAGNPLQIVEHEYEAGTGEFEVAEGMAKLTFADVEGFASEADAKRIKKAVQLAKSQVAARPAPQAAKSAAADAKPPKDSSDDGVLRITVEGRTPEALQAIEALDTFGDDDSDDSDDSDDPGDSGVAAQTDSGHFGKLFAAGDELQGAPLSLFGRMWTLVDRMCTKSTNALLADLKQSEDAEEVYGNVANYYASPGDQAMATRQSLLTGSVLGELGGIMNRLRIEVSVDREIRMLVSTLELNSSMAVFTTGELQLLGIVFVLALGRSLGGLQRAIDQPTASAELDAVLAGLGGDRSLLDVLGQRLHDTY
ncbi:hypothetical protein IWW50_004597 [Coemansia erecta]|nr:hypothetical protein IWW50_004597 [Coemansia erecta]